MPSAFFLIILVQKFNENYAFIVGGPALGDVEASWKFFAEVVSRSSTILFLGLLSILFIIRLEPIKKAKGILTQGFGDSWYFLYGAGDHLSARKSFSYTNSDCHFAKSGGHCPFALCPSYT